MDVKKLIGQRIRDLRKGRGLSQDKLAELSHINPKHLSSIEGGKENVTIELLAKVAHGLNVQIRELFEIDDDSVQDLKRRARGLVAEIPPGELRRIVRVLEALIHG